MSTFADSSDGTMYALQAHDGSMLCEYPILDPTYNPPIMDGNTVYLGTTNGMLYALRADNGKLVWHFLIQVTQ